MSEKKRISPAKQKVTQVLNQAKESFKILEGLDKSSLSKALHFVGIPSSAERKRMTNEKILSHLKKLGLATQSELTELQIKVEALQTVAKQAKQQINQAKDRTASTNSSTTKRAGKNLDN